MNQPESSTRYSDADTASANGPVMVAAFYRFAALPECRDMRERLRELCDDLQLQGTILLAHEGINGTVAGSEASVTQLLKDLRSDPRLAQMQARISFADTVPFHRMKVRIKKEIVSMGVAGIDPAEAAGEYVAPQDWNALIKQPNVRLIDTRNDYEVNLGTFEGAQAPDTRSFREFPAWADEHLDPHKGEAIAMFCTGGIRCEKATAYLKKRGFDQVYHLQGGILNYLETVNPTDSAWQGDCFVFDSRVTVDHALQAGDFEVCPACRMPVTEEDRASAMFELHVSCPQCFDRLTPERREGLLERARQMALAAQRGEKHLGSR